VGRIDLAKLTERQFLINHGLNQFALPLVLPGQLVIGCSNIASNYKMTVTAGSQL